MRLAVRRQQRGRLSLADALHEGRLGLWRALARLLAGPHGAGWRRSLGVADGQTPSASGRRYCLPTVGVDLVAGLCPRCVALLRTHGLCLHTCGRLVRQASTRLAA